MIEVLANAPDKWLTHFPRLKPDSNKYSRGHVLVFGGPVMTGAARLAARAAQRIGAGLVTLAAPAIAGPIYTAALESIIVKPLKDDADWQQLCISPKTNAILVGPGMGFDAVPHVLTALATRKPTILDADALTGFAGAPAELFSALHPACVLTPHEGEFARLFGHAIDPAIDKLAKTRAAAALAKCIVVLKGAETIIAAPDGRAYRNDNAPPWLATGGAGDVLAGLIAGLAAQGMPMTDAAAAAVWLHGYIAGRFGLGLIAEDLIDGIPAALKSLFPVS